MAIGYVLLTASYYTNVFHGRNLAFMSTSLFDLNGDTYNQTAVIDANHRLNPDALETIGLPRYTTTYALSQLCYNLALGAAFTSMVLWHWPELSSGMPVPTKSAFGIRKD